jgi:hypothetical protein
MAMIRQKAMPKIVKPSIVLSKLLPQRGIVTSEGLIRLLGLKEILKIPIPLEKFASTSKVEDQKS